MRMLTTMDLLPTFCNTHELQYIIWVSCMTRSTEVCGCKLQWCQHLSYWTKTVFH